MGLSEYGSLIHTNYESDTTNSGGKGFLAEVQSKYFANGFKFLLLIYFLLYLFIH